MIPSHVRKLSLILIILQLGTAMPASAFVQLLENKPQTPDGRSSNQFESDQNAAEAHIEKSNDLLNWQNEGPTAQQAVIEAASDASSSYPDFNFTVLSPTGKPIKAGKSGDAIWIGYQRPSNQDIYYLYKEDTPEGYTKGQILSLSTYNGVRLINPSDPNYTQLLDGMENYANEALGYTSDPTEVNHLNFIICCIKDFKSQAFQSMINQARSDIKQARLAGDKQEAEQLKKLLRQLRKEFSKNKQQLKKLQRQLFR